MHVARNAFHFSPLALALLAAAPARAVQAPILSIDGQSPEVGFGTALAGAGDVNGDGTPDLVVGAQFSLGYRGAARVVSGANGGTLHALINASPKGQAGDQFGRSVAGLSDLDGDGLAEFAVAQDYVGLAQLGGRVVIFRGADASVLHLLNASSAGAKDFGMGLADVGDLDGDGADDLAVGVPDAQLGGTNKGSVILLSGTTGQVLATLPAPIGPVPYLSHFGHAVAGAGDMNLDGVPDLVVGAPYVEPTGNNKPNGAVYVFSGADGSKLFSRIGADWDLLGSAVAGGRDVDSGGLPDLLIGAPQNPFFGQLGAGYAELISGESQAVLFSLAGSAIDDSCGAALSLADVDLDDHIDLLIADPWWELPGQSSTGRVRVVSGDGFGPLAEVHGANSFEKLGTSLAVIGDINRDGSPEWGAGIPGSVAGVYGEVQVFAGASPWTDLGFGLAGSFGVPVATASGIPSPSSTVTIELAGGPPSGMTTLVVGGAALQAPFKGGVMVPFPGMLLSVPLGASGGVALHGAAPPSLPVGTQFWLQFWMADAGAVKGFSASNGLTATVE